MSTAAAPSVTSASQRPAAKSASKKPAAASTQSEPVKFSHRQAEPFRKEDLVEFEVPNLTVKDLLSAIPAHCFERSAVRSFSYVIMDAILVASAAFLASYIDPTLKSLDFSATPLTPYLSAGFQYSLARFAAWGAYAFVQGLFLTGVWVLAHECGHQSFSTSKTLNNAVGWVLHSALLVPYHSWRISHARHHAGTGHLTRDEVFVPRTRQQKGLLPLRPAPKSDNDSDADEQEEVPETNGAHGFTGEETFGEWLHEVLEDAPLYNFIYLLVQQLLGWPLYLIQNSSGQLHFPKGTNHFNPESVIFDHRHRNQVIASDVGIALTLSALGTWAFLSDGGIGEVARYYIAPYMWVNHWLVMITYLQHTDPLLPHYKPEAWTFPRGALCTIDRNWMGPVGPYLFHGIAETHVAHHISSKIPHYHAWEATEALKNRLGVHYQKSEENVFVSLWKSVRQCKWIDANDQVAFYRNAKGVPKAVVAPTSGYNSDSGIAMSE